jgi:uroporphyrinogen decarboxylase
MGRSRVQKAVHFQRPDAIPIWTEDICTDTSDKYGDRLRAILNDFRSDMMELKYDPPTHWTPETEGEDEWGCRWRKLDGTVGQVVAHPLGHDSGYSACRIPDPDAPGRFDAAKRRRDSAGDVYAFGTNQFTLFERLRFLRGDQALLQDFCDRPAPLMRLIDEMVQFNLRLVDRWHGVGVDCIRLTDDWGTQRGLFISPGMWREYFKPCYETLCSRCHQLGMDVQFHSCGNIMAIVGDLVECGVDIVNPIQPGAMDIEQTGSRTRGKVCCMGGIDTQQTLRSGTPQQVRDEVFRTIRCLATPEGGYLCCPATTILEDVPLENIVALFQAAGQFAWD